MKLLENANLGQVARLPRTQWRVVRAAFGRARRLSLPFLREERTELEEWRELVRSRHADMRSGQAQAQAAAGLAPPPPTDPPVPPPLTVGQRVFALHRRTRDMHLGSILTLGRSSYRVQFDRPELGVEMVGDSSVMPIAKGAPGCTPAGAGGAPHMQMRSPGAGMGPRGEGAGAAAGAGAHAHALAMQMHQQGMMLMAGHSPLEMQRATPLSGAGPRVAQGQGAAQGHHHPLFPMHSPVQPGVFALSLEAAHAQARATPSCQ